MNIFAKHSILNVLRDSEYASPAFLFSNSNVATALIIQKYFTFHTTHLPTKL